MIEEQKRIEFWNYLTNERNQPRPKGITPQRLAVVKPVAINSDFWLAVIERHGAGNLAAREFYQSADAASTNSRTEFWNAVRGIIRQSEDERRINGRRKRNAGRSKIAVAEQRKTYRTDYGKRF